MHVAYQQAQINLAVSDQSQEWLIGLTRPTNNGGSWDPSSLNDFELAEGIWSVFQIS